MIFVGPSLFTKTNFKAQIQTLKGTSLYTLKSFFPLKASLDDLYMKSLAQLICNIKHFEFQNSV